MSFRKYSKLKDRITIQIAEKGKDENYQPTVIYEDLLSCWASFEPQYMRDKVKTAGTTLENTVNFIVRYDQKKQIQRDHYILHNGVRYRIEDVSRGTYSKDFDTLIAKEVSKEDVLNEVVK